MILLDGHSLKTRDCFEVESMSLELAERTSTASITVGPEVPEITVGDWLRDDCEPGEGIVWRVRSVNTQYDRNTRTIQMEHVISTLKDILLFGESTPEKMGGMKDSVPALTVVNYALARQNDWILGQFQYNQSAPYTFNGDTIFSILETVSSTLEDCIWEYDMSRYPFVLHIRRMTDEIDSEMRMDRNIQTMRKTVDRSRMYTRHYPIGKNNLHISGDYVSRNENLYGIICKVETDQSKDSEEKLRSWSTERLLRHCEPSVTVTINGLELSDATGEPLDHFRIGKKCRVPLPEFSTTIRERVTKLSWRDKKADPENVTITLANELLDVATILKQNEASGGGGGRAAAKNAEEDHAWFVDTTDHVAMVAEAVAGEGASKDWSRVSQVLVDGQGIHQRVTKAEGDIVVAQNAIEVNENEIRLEANRAKKEEKSLNSRITVEADKISLVVESRNGKSVIKAASIVAGINAQGGSVIKLSADTINLSGYVTMSDLAATNANINNLTTGQTTAAAIKATNMYANGGFWFKGVQCDFKTVTISGTTYHLVGYT